MVVVSDITLYTRPSCSECVKAKNLLKDNQISFKEIEIDKDISRDELLEQFPSAKVLPLIVLTHKAIFNGYPGLVEYLNEEGMLLA